MSDQFLDAAMLAQFRSDVAGMLPDVCTLQAFGKVDDGAGAYTEAWTTIASNVPCRLDPKPLQGGSGIDVLAQKEAVEALYQLTIAYTATIEIGYRVVTGGKTYEIRQLHGDHSNNVSIRAIVVRVE